MDLWLELPCVTHVRTPLTIQGDLTTVRMYWNLYDSQVVVYSRVVVTARNVAEQLVVFFSCLFTALHVRQVNKHTE